METEYTCTECGYEDTRDMLEAHLIEGHGYSCERTEVEMSYIIRDAEEAFDPRRDAWVIGD